MRALSWLALTAALVASPAFADPPTLTGLRNQFKTWDLNKDGSLDKEELAKVFRGPNAKPYDSPIPETSTPDSKTLLRAGVRVFGYLGAVEGSGPLLAASTLLAKKTDDKTADFKSFPDYQFLQQVDKDGDGKISRAEFDLWAHDYVAEMKKQYEIANRIARAEARLSGNLGTAERRKAEAELRKDKQALDKMNNDMKAFERQLLKAGQGK